MGRLVSVVLVTWNSAEWLSRCLEGIERQTHRQRELIVVDNASSDESLSLVRHAHIIRNQTNVGFATAVNQAIRIAKGEFVQLVNPDAFLEPDYIEQVLTAFDAEDVGMATGKLLRAGGSGIDSMGIRMTRTGRHLDIVECGGLPPPFEGAGKPAHSMFEVFGVSGAAGMYRMAFLDDVAVAGEPFDSDFFAYREDADIAWRGRLFGWRAMCVPRAIAHHVRRVTPEVRRSLPSEINMHSLKNRFLLRLKNEGLYLALRNAPFELARDLVAIGAALTIERTSLPAFAWLWRNRRNILAERHAIQLRRRVSDREIAKWFR